MACPGCSLRGEWGCPGWGSSERPPVPAGARPGGGEGRAALLAKQEHARRHWGGWLLCLVPPSPASSPSSALGVTSHSLCPRTGFMAVLALPGRVLPPSPHGARPAEGRLLPFLALFILPGMLRILALGLALGPAGLYPWVWQPVGTRGTCLGFGVLGCCLLAGGFRWKGVGSPCRWCVPSQSLMSPATRKSCPSAPPPLAWSSRLSLFPACLTFLRSSS